MGVRYSREKGCAPTYIIGTTKLRQNAHIVLSRPQSTKPPRHGYSMQAKAPPHDMRGDFAIASEGIASRLRYPLGSI